MYMDPIVLSLEDKPTLWAIFNSVTITVYYNYSLNNMHNIYLSTSTGTGEKLRPEVK